MGRLQRNSMIIAVGAALMLWCGSLFFNRDVLHQERQAPVSLEATCAESAEAPATLADVRTIPQDLGPFAAGLGETMPADMRHRIARQFHRQYFAPWTATEPLFNAVTVTEGVRQLATRTWYGENRLRVDPARMQSLLILADWEHFPSMQAAGVVVKPAFIRILPTVRPFYVAPDDVPFDHLQFSEAKLNEPVRILHASRDGAWLYVETSSANGWVAPDAIGLADASMQNRLIDAEQLVVVKDYITVRTERGEALPQPKIGTLYPLVKEERDHWLVDAAVAGDGRRAVLKTARIAKSDARRHPLPFSPETVTLIGNELLKTPYGWGELYRNRDCSATTRDFFLALGIWLPRNSLKQITSGPFVPLTGLSGSDKKNRIRAQGIPFRTLLHLKGHIMLYVGLQNDQPVVLHTIWSLRYAPKNCTEQSFIIGRTIVSTLEAGKELPLTKGTLLDRLEGMLTLPVVD